MTLPCFISLCFNQKTKVISVLGVATDVIEAEESAKKRAKNNSYLVVDFMSPVRSVNMSLEKWLIGNSIPTDKVRGVIVNIAREIGKVMEEIGEDE